MDFTVPLQKNTEREIFDYIDIDNLQKLLNSLKHNPEENNPTPNTEVAEISTENLNNTDDIESNDESDSDNLEKEINSENKDIEEEPETQSDI